MIHAYLRVSTDKQDIENQRHGIEEYIKKNSFQDVCYYEDTVSGKKEWYKRELGRLLKQTNRDDIIIASEISRLARSTIQVLEVLQEALKRGVHIHIVKSGMIMDGSINSRITGTILGLAAEVEREFISARTKEALARRKELGHKLGRKKGNLNIYKKLDPHNMEIRKWLAEGKKRTQMCKDLHCHMTTLHKWMKQNGLSRYIDSERGEKIRNHITRTHLENKAEAEARKTITQCVPQSTTTTLPASPTIRTPLQPVERSTKVPTSKGKNKLSVISREPRPPTPPPVPTLTLKKLPIYRQYNQNKTK